MVPLFGKVVFHNARGINVVTNFSAGPIEQLFAPDKSLNESGRCYVGGKIVLPTPRTHTHKCAPTTVAVL